MKQHRIVRLSALVLCALSLAACTKTEQASRHEAPAENAVEQAITQSSSAEERTLPDEPDLSDETVQQVLNLVPSELLEEEPAALPDPSVDIDLTTMSATMVYTEVYGMMTSPEDYIGMRVKMTGPLATYHDEATGEDYYACVIRDATACCSQGLEFELQEGYSYPAEGETVRVIGDFDVYTEGEYRYVTLRDAKLVE